MTNPQSEFCRCEKPKTATRIIEERVADNMIVKEHFCLKCSLPVRHPKESPVSQSVEQIGGADAIIPTSETLGVSQSEGHGYCIDTGIETQPQMLCECPIHKSQSVEGWEEKNYKEEREIMCKMHILDKNCECCKNTLNALRLKDELLASVRSTTLSTLVKEMEGLKNVDPRENRHKTHPGISWDKCEACVEDYNFNAGISAAVEVVKKMVS